MQPGRRDQHRPVGRRYRHRQLGRPARDPLGMQPPLG
jgi:hypothetical protein